ncbi:MAG: LysR substrate-binding domain-containing protein [Aestuariivirgaceae bacterium]|nr:LysR substrate-binding domain-containing protein [Aestuariivirgaceae bacterium]
MSHAQLKAFHAVARMGGFSRAAANLGLTQPAISDHVRKLEEAHGVQLFRRLARGVELTELGRRLFALTERLFETESEVDELLSRARGLREGTLLIGADAPVHVLPLLARFRERYPAISLKLTRGNTASLMAQLESFAIDFAVLAELPATPALRSRPLSESHLIAFAASGFPQSAISVTELASHPLVLREEGSLTRRLLEQEFAKRGLRPRNVLEIEGREAAAEAVAQGLGLGIVSQSEFVASAQLVPLEFTDWHAPMREWLVCLESRAGLHILRALLDLTDEEEARYRRKNPRNA